jgi:hypothetical protein
MASAGNNNDVAMENKESDSQQPASGSTANEQASTQADVAQALGVSSSQV